MTTHRDLKKLIRERAARTGESYTTARRHVLARAGRAAALPAGLVPGYVPFSTGLHHDSTLLAHLLRQARRGRPRRAAGAAAVPAAHRRRRRPAAGDRRPDRRLPAAEPDPALFAALADQVDTAREAESRAAALLTS